MKGEWVEEHMIVSMYCIGSMSAKYSSSSAEWYDAIERNS